MTRRRHSRASEVSLDVSSGFWLRSYRPASRMSGGHVHSDIEVNCLRRGRLHYLIAGRMVEVEAGRAVVFWGGLPHETVQLEGEVEGVWVTLPLGMAGQWNLPQNLLGQLMGGHVLLTGIDEQIAGVSPQVLERWLDDVASGQADRLASVQLEVHAWFRRMAIHLSPGPTHGASDFDPGRRLGAVGRALQYIHRHYTEDLDLTQVAAAANMHPKSLVRAFRRVTVYTPWEYVLRMRIAHAQSLLATTDRKVLDIALTSGFDSMAPFYQAFRRWTGDQTPRDFRARFRQDGMNRRG